MKLDNFYIQEAITQAQYGILSFSSFENALALGDTSLVFYHIHHFVIHVTNIHKLCFPEKTNEFRKKILLDIQNSIDIDIKPIRDLRNHLEHFDERMDKYVKNYKGQPYFDNNIITGCKGFPKNNCLRVLDGYKYIFYGEEFDIKYIYMQLQPLIDTFAKLQTK